MVKGGSAIDIANVIGNMALANAAINNGGMERQRDHREGEI
jgi:hypothetical protein